MRTGWTSSTTRHGRRSGRSSSPTAASTSPSWRRRRRLGKYTLAELEEEEQSLDRLRRWYRELRSRDLLGAAAMTTATTQLKVCQEQFEQYAEHVYAALNGPHG